MEETFLTLKASLNCEKSDDQSYLDLGFIACGDPDSEGRGVAPNFGPWVQSILLGPGTKYHSGTNGGVLYFYTFSFIFIYVLSTL